MAPTQLEIASTADSIVSRQYELQHSHPPPAMDYTPLVVSIVLLAIAWSAIVLRLHTRLYLIRAVGWDDITMIIALLFFTGFSGADMEISVSRTELEFMKYPEILAVIKAWIIVDAFYCATQTMLKISVGIFLLRVIIRKHHRWIVYGVMAISTVWGVATMIFAIFQCGVPKSAELYVEKRIFNECVSPPSVLGMSFVLGGVTALSDVTFTVLPIFILRDAKMNKRAKISLGIILGLGGLGSIASLVRFVYLGDIGQVTNDFFINTTNLSIWSTLECGLGIAAGSFATLRPLFRKFLTTARNSITITKTQLSRARHTYARHSVRGSRGGSADFGFMKNPFHWKRASSDLEIGCRGESPLTPITGISEVYDGKSAGGSKLGNETTITVGLVQSPPEVYGNYLKRNISGSKDRGSEITEWPITLGPGMIEREMVFETMSERCSRVERINSLFGNGSDNSEGSSEKMEKMAKAWLF
ncbi:hypothetical protein NA57DRAFT_58009 [Rhizodiscina lignyota]|uniref:Rhodopsin domain-containing protein n=1 Tax=Rhizodiscina lignyota TaxID=1504668 RepID=A0A9P4M941_9PEZI|nr:hypothetical protein NA57DRAFT_58009 [Rhizodiscina lignyota]